ncbi:DUF421 domain-containing protein [Paenibacillus jilunlii]|uniref:Uncharacterized membrane protein YcaP, DUF421 family n=1 Tax=Paenibacillus jilunlii TaxID=682956 RepID=A0A1G9Y6A9_9BACL|nr:DUF421 domain-containing protein [Paenibacillus jilunlii]KWX77575.1 hypothetical protein AML91_07225 [Paenibacillus jilunlii]SDN04629.1 Uncharacterized membrane protein YcaP, DUF421 family [Paenibacillus jilunlii]
MEYLSVLVKLIAGFVGLWAMTRLLGKKEISALTPFDFISAVILGDLVGDTIYEPDKSVLLLLFALAVWTVLSIIFEKITQLVRKLRKPLEGEPEILIRDGKIDLAKLRKNNLDFEQLRMMLRAKDTFSMNEVAYAIYETNGSLSILKKPQYEPATREELDIKPQHTRLPRSLVESGVVQRAALSSLGHDETWLRRKLQEKGHPDLDSVAYAEINEEGELAIIPSTSQQAKPGEY